MPQWRRIAVIQSWPLSKAKDAWIDDSPPPINHPPETIVRVKAWIDMRQDRSLMSDKLAAKLLGDRNQVNCIGIRYYHVIDKTIGMRRLKIVHGLECDAIFCDNSSADCAPELPFQRWNSWTMTSDNGSSSEPLNSAADGQSSIEDCDNETQPWTSRAPPSNVEETPGGYSYQQSELLSIAASHGFLVMNPSSLGALASLLSLSHQGSTDNSLQGNVESPVLRDWVPDTIQENKPLPSVQTSVSTSSNSDSDHMGSDQESWSTYSSQYTLCSIHPQDTTPVKPIEVSRQIPRSENLEYEYRSLGIMSSVDTDSFSANGGTSTYVVSENLFGENEDSLEREKKDIQAMSDSFFESPSSLNEFENHPGHKIWEWDIARQQWHKKGGTTEADWFPERFA
ncbi:Fc.00g039790.m01.CDS01 [Cosmosporella sp. VM-42]